MTDYSDTVIFRASKSLKTRAEEAATNNDVSLSEFVRSAIRDKIQDQPLPA